MKGAEAIRSDEDLKIYTSGTNNILKYPELTEHRGKDQRADQCI